MFVIVTDGQENSTIRAREGAATLKLDPKTVTNIERRAIRAPFPRPKPC